MSLVTRATSTTLANPQDLCDNDYQRTNCLICQPADAQRGGFSYARSGVSMAFPGRNQPQRDDMPATVWLCREQIKILSQQILAEHGNRGEQWALRQKQDRLLDHMDRLTVDDLRKRLGL